MGDAEERQGDGREGEEEKDQFVFKLGDYFVSDKSLGQGSYAKVRLATDKERAKLYAIKIIKKPETEQEKHYTRIKREVECLKGLRHPHIIQLDDVFQTKRFICIVTEYASGGDLYDFLKAQPNQRLSETEALKLFWQMIDAVAHCHSQHIVHRDLKPENVLLSDRVVKIADFGFSRTFDPENQMLSTCCGSLGYAAPELLVGEKYVGQQADIWSLGVILYTMLCGSGPFGVEEGINIEAEHRMMSGTIKQSPLLSDEMRELISAMLKPDPSDRITIAELQELRAAWEHRQSRTGSPAVARRLDGSGSDEERAWGDGARGLDDEAGRASATSSTDPGSPVSALSRTSSPAGERPRDRDKRGGLMGKLRRMIRGRDASPPPVLLRRRSKSGNDLESAARASAAVAEPPQPTFSKSSSDDSSGERSRSITL